MNAPFPFGFPWPTALYLTLYVGTWVVHFLFMNYVLAGSTYLAWVSAFPGAGPTPRADLPTARVLRDWMPFALSGVVTAGIAPLLFVQVAYGEAFYTANLLMFPAWGAVVPVLILGFYLLYVMKSRAVAEWPWWGRTLVAGGALACFAFTGWMWAANHLVSIDSTSWPSMYDGVRTPYTFLGVSLRLLVWWTAAFGPMAMAVGWQLYYVEGKPAFDVVALPKEQEIQAKKPNDPPAAPPVWSGVHQETRMLAMLAMAGLGLCGVLGLLYALLLDGDVKQPVLSILTAPYWVAAAVGLALQLWAWETMRKAGELRRTPLILATVGAVLMVVGAGVVRESIRLARADLDKLLPYHGQTFDIGGWQIFFPCLVLNGLVVAYIFYRVRKGLAVGR